MPTPSLLIVPARFKTGKLYSQIPTSGAGDFTVTRNTEATRVNASGLIESVASGIPRLDYSVSGFVTGCPALLVEPSGTNLLSSNLSSTGAYSRQGVSGITTITGGFPSPSNITAYKIIPDGVSGQHRIFATINVADHNFSVFCKPDGYNFVSLAEGGGLTASNIIFDIQNGTISGSLAGFTPFIQPYVDGWYQIGYSRTTTLTNTTRWIIVRDANNTNNYQGDGVKGILFAGPQITAGLHLQSVIFGGANTTRAADVISVSGAVSGSIGQTEGVVYAQVDLRNWVASGRVLAISDGTSDARVVIQVGANRTLQAVVTAASGEVANIATASGQVNGIYKCALAYASGDFAFYVNGNQIGTDSSGAVPACNNVALGKIETSASTNFLNDRILAGALYNTRLTNPELAALTSP